MNNAKRIFYPGEEWVYYKIYCQPRTADEVLIRSIAPLTEDLMSNGLISSWFFIRYRDPNHHIRLRMRVVHLDDLSKIMSTVLQKLKYFTGHDMIAKIQLDTYVRELERYGHDTMDLCERLFCLDSQLALHANHQSSNDEKLLAFAITMMSFYIADFGLSYDERQSFITINKEAFKQEFQIKSTDLQQFREKLDILQTGINHYRENPYKLFKELGNFKLIRKEMKTTTREILAVISNDGSTSKNALLSSLLHMSINRIFRDDQRLFELIAFLSFH